MTRSAWRTGVLRQCAVCGVLAAMPAAGGVIEISGSASTDVIQFDNLHEVQRDFNQESVPQTRPLPPAIARSQLDRLLSDGTVTAAGQGIAVLNTPDFAGLGPPNDVGLDLGAFSDDSVTSWSVSGVVTERRTIILEPLDLGADVLPGGQTRMRSRVVLSGVMAVTAMDPAMDLTGLEVSLELRIVQHPPDPTGGLDPPGPITVLEGEVELAGGPDGTVQIVSATGAFEGVPLPVVDFVDFLAEMALIRAIFFAGFELTYEYDVIAGEPFELDLWVRAEVDVIPGHTGASAVFGVPQDVFPALLQRVKRDDTGGRVAALFSEHVDTTGRAYQEETGLAPPRFFFPLCGVFGFEAVCLTFMAGWWWRARGGRHRLVRQSCRE